jgi:hypothetical protein
MCVYVRVYVSLYVHTNKHARTHTESHRFGRLRAQFTSHEFRNSEPSWLHVVCYNRVFSKLLAYAHCIACYFSDSFRLCFIHETQSVLRSS